MRKYLLDVLLIRNKTKSDYNISFDRSTNLNEECTCPCVPDRDGLCQYRSGLCYEPVCPPGTYLCCASCRFSACARNSERTISTRGIRECIMCPPGHFCSGCDLPQSCPDGTMSPNSSNKVASDCRPCTGELAVSFDRTSCCDSDSCGTPGDFSSNYFSTIESSSGTPRSTSLMLVSLLTLIHAHL